MQKIINFKFIQYLPFVFLAGPLFLEIYFFLLFVLNFKKINFKLLEINVVKILLVLFFISILISSFLSDHNISLLKGVSYIRFLIYIFILELVITLDENNIKKFCKSAIIVSIILISFNFFQLITGYNLDDQRTTLPIRLEPITGSFLTYFSAYIFSFVLWRYETQKQNLFLTIIIIALILFGCLISGERISSLVIICLILSLTLFKSKKLFLIFLIIILTIPTSLKLFDENKRSIYIEKRFNSFSETIQNFDDSIWYHHFYAAEKSWKQNILFGNGVRSFRIDCKKFETEKKLACASHPHNIYLEFLSEIGLIGLSLFILTMVTLMFKNIFILIKHFNNKTIENYLLMGLILYLIINYFPIKSFGSFFNNFNSFGFWIMFYFVLTIGKKMNNLKNTTK